MSKRFSIIIVTWNAIDHLKRFLPSVAESEHNSVEIILADNASEDDTASWVQERFPEIKVVTFNRNHGYCGGNNRAVKYAEGEILIFLNNDAGVSPEWLSPIDTTFQDPQTGIVQPKILSAEQKTHFEYAGAAGGYIDKLGYPFCRGRLFDTVEEDHGQYDEPGEIFWASGAAFAIRKELFERLGGFDESFEFHMEEIDLCWRAHHAGVKVISVPDSVVYHLGGGSMPMGSPRKVYYNYRNSLLMLTKNLEVNPVIPLFTRLCLDGIAGIRSLLSGRPSETFAVIRSHFAFYKRLPDALKKRRRLKSERKKSVPGGLIYPKLIIFEYFLKGKKRFSDLNRKSGSTDS